MWGIPLVYSTLQCWLTVSFKDMKNFSIQSLALVVMTVTVYASSLQYEKDMLRLIYEEAKNTSLDKVRKLENDVTHGLFLFVCCIMHWLSYLVIKEVVCGKGSRTSHGMCGKFETFYNYCDYWLVFDIYQT